ncbi:hypothetical protein V7O61_06555 [Methanolobus sp. WCC1]|uniref:hypothetical protein n=1 Tax=unclassified Methanolobus TaxID=2629569 RepID=UPI00324487F2
MNINAEIFKHFGLPQVIPEFPSRCISHDENPLFTNIIDCRQPGSGKTQNAVEYVAVHPEMKFLIIGNTHLLLEEINSRIAEINPAAKGRVIRGFSKACPKYETHDDIKDAHEAGVPPKAICIRMECQNSPGRPCGYRTQYEGLFDELGQPQINVLIPINLIEAFDFSVFDCIIIEESTATNGKYERDYDFAFIKKEMGKLQYSRGYGKSGFLKYEDQLDFIRAINKRDAKAIKKMAPMLQEAIDKHNTYTAVMHQKRKMQSTFIDDIVKVRLNSLIMCLEFRNGRMKKRLTKIEQINREILADNTYQEAQMKEILADLNKLKNDALKNYQHSIDMEKATDTDHFQATWQEIIFYQQLRAKCDIRYNNTTFSKRIFLRQVENFQQLFPEYRQESIIVESDNVNQDTRIKVKNNNGFYKSYIESYYKLHGKELRNTINYWKRKNKKILAITFKQLVKNGKFCGVDAFWFGGFGGTNDFRDYDILIVFGSPIPPESWYQETLESTFPDEEMPETIEYEDTPDWKRPTNEMLRFLFDEVWMMQIYNDIHRVRPLEHNVKIIWFGKNIPPKLTREFTVEN